MTEQESGARDPRDEAERLIASVLGSASVAAENLRGFATGSAECCVCPVCKAIAAAREPNPQVAEKIASGAGDLASGVASFLRTMARAASDIAGSAGAGGSRGAGGSAGTGDQAGRGGSGFAGTAAEDPWHTATRAAAEAEAAGTATGTGAGASSTTPGAAEPAATPNPPKPMAKKAVKPKAPADPPAEPSATTPDEER